MIEKILIIDDHDIFRSSITVFLEARGFQVLEASDGIDGLSLFHEHHPCLVITDINVPGRNGVQIAQEICASEKPVPLFVITGLPNSNAFFDVAQNSGAVKCFTKPLDLMVLCKEILHTLGRKQGPHKQLSSKQAAAQSQSAAKQ